MSDTSAPDWIAELDLAALAAGLADGRWTARRLVEGYLARIAAIDAGPDGLRSVLEVNPDALTIADDLDRERGAGTIRGPLHGVPILLKDNIDTADQMLTTAGSLALIDSRPSRDATVAAKLRGAGAILLGKTNMSEWANFRSTRSSSGWSSRGRQTKNPYVRDRTPGGSSPGSGVAAAASLCAAAIGTETNGSIVSPADSSGVVGIKPTVGLTSRAGVIPISHTQDTIGPLARTVADAATVLAAISVPDPRDPATEAQREHVLPDVRSLLDRDGLRGARIGVARSVYFGYSEHADRLANRAIARMREAGATIVDAADIPTAKAMADSPTVRDVMCFELKAGLNAYLAERGDPAIHSLTDVIAFNVAHADRVMPYFQQELLDLAEATTTLTDTAYLDALATNFRLSRDAGLDAVLDGHGLDALVAPTAAPAWTIDQVNGDRRLGSSSTPAALAGYPLVSVPVGLTPFGLPVNLTIMGRAWSEPTLIRLAYALEQLLPPRTQPTYVPSLPLP